MRSLSAAASPRRIIGVPAAVLVTMGLGWAGGSASAADFLGFVGEGSVVSTSSGVRYVLDVYAEFAQSAVNVVNVYESSISHVNGSAFSHSDTNTIQSIAGTWSPTAAVAVGGASPLIDTFVVIGGPPGSSNTTTLDPSFAPATALVPPADAGWFNSNPANSQGVIDPSTRRLMVGRFVTATAGETLQISAWLTFADIVGGVNGTAQQVQRSASIPYPLLECNTLLASASTTAVPAAGTSSAISASVDVAHPACSWSASSNAEWLLLAGSSGTGDGSFTFSASPNLSTSARSATITVSSGTATSVAIVVTQAGAIDCGFTASPSQRSVSFIGSLYGSSWSVEVAADPSCAWTAAPAAGSGWLTIQSGASGTGNGTVTYAVAANFFLPIRTGTIEIRRAGTLVATHTVVQAQPAPECTGVVEFASSGTTISAPAGTHSVLVSTGGTTCAWYATVVAGASWLSLENGASFTGNGQVTFTVSANASPSARTGTISIGSGANQRTYTITQNGACSGTVALPAQRLVPWLGSIGGDTFGFALNDGGSGCAWSLVVAAGSPSWITLTTPASGSGSAAVGYAAEINLFAVERTATIDVVVSGTVVATHLIRQAGPAVQCTDPITFDPASAAVPAAGVNLEVQVETNGVTCAWYAESTAPWITITNGAAFTGDGTISVTIDANPGSGSRSGSITIGSGGALSSFSISQAGTGGVTCDILAASSASTTVAPAGTISPVTVSVTTAGSACSWSAGSNQPWLVLSGASGTGASGSFTFTASENLSTSSRSATITVFSGTAAPVLIAITQQGYAVCSTPPTVTPATREVASAAGSNSVAVSTPSGTCAWTATVTSGGAWLSITSGGSGLGSGAIAYAFTANAAASSRTGVITLTGGATHTITQSGSGSACNSLAASATVPGSTTVPAAGTASAVAIAVTTAGSACSWSAGSNQGWLVLSGASGTGASGSFTFTASENLSTSSRSATITVTSGSAAPVLIAITQQGYAACGIAPLVTPATRSVAASAGSDTVAISTLGGTCAWTATVTSGGEWLSITSGSSSIGAGTIAYAFTANATAGSRTGVITITGGATHTVTQAGQGVPCLPWTPAELGLTLQCWLDGSQLSGSNGTPISVWTDASGNGLNGVQSGANRPTVATGALNGLNVVNFNGSQWFDHNTAREMLRNRSAAIMAVVMKYGSVGNGQWQFAWTNRKGNSPGDVALRFQLLHNQANRLSAYSSRLDSNASFSEAQSNSPLYYNTSYHIQVVNCQWSSGVMAYSIDGAMVSTAAYSSSGNTSDTSLGTAANAWTAIGSGPRDGSLALRLSLGSQIAEMICVAKSSGTFSDDDRLKLEGYLAWKWGLQVNLPPNHPYKNAAPTVGDCVQSLVVNPDTTQLPAPGVNQPVHVSVAAASGAAWSATSSEPWLAIAQSATGSPDAFGFTAAPNLGMLPRTAVVTVTAANGETASFEVRQQAPCEHVGGGDCNGDGISDLCAIAWGLASDRNGNGLPDVCEVGTTVTVPGDFATVQAAVDAAVDGWTIVLDPGTHAGPVVIDGRSITIEAKGPLGSVILEGAGLAGPVVAILDDPSRGSILPTTLRGIVISGGSQGTALEHGGQSYSAGGGLLVVGAAVSIESCLITTNQAGHGGGIAAVSSLVSIVETEIAGNAADHAGGGIVLLDSVARIDDTAVHGNAATLGAGLWVDATSTVEVSSSTICGNQPDQIAGPWQDLGGNAPCTCVGDLNGDGAVNGSDLATLLAAWGQSNSPHDLDDDGVVSGSDLAAILAAWGECP